MPDAIEEGTPLLGPSRSESPVRPRRLFEERRGCCSSPLIICVGLSLGVWLSVRVQAQAPPVAGTNRTSAATPPSSVEQQQPWERPSASGGGPGERTQQPVVPQQYDEVPVPAPRAALLPRFDGTLEAALHAAVPAGRPRFLLLTFGNAAIGPLLRNFALHCRRAGIPHVVGAVDVGAFELLAAPGGDGSLEHAATPVYKTPLALRGAYKMDGGNSHSSSSWKQARYLVITPSTPRGSRRAPSLVG